MGFFFQIYFIQREIRESRYVQSAYGTFIRILQQNMSIHQHVYKSNPWDDCSYDLGVHIPLGCQAYVSLPSRVNKIHITPKKQIGEGEAACGEKTINFLVHA